MTETFIVEVGGGYKWWLLSEFNNHVIAQGFIKRRQTAVRQAEQEQYKFTIELM